jgi:hypothetical protein
MHGSMRRREETKPVGKTVRPRRLPPTLPPPRDGAAVGLIDEQHLLADPEAIDILGNMSESLAMTPTYPSPKPTMAARRYAFGRDIEEASLSSQSGSQPGIPEANTRASGRYFAFSTGTSFVPEKLPLSASTSGRRMASMALICRQAQAFGCGKDDSSGRAQSSARSRSSGLSRCPPHRR